MSKMVSYWFANLKLYCFAACCRVAIARLSLDFPRHCERVQKPTGYVRWKLSVDWEYLIDGDRLGRPRKYQCNIMTLLQASSIEECDSHLTWATVRQERHKYLEKIVIHLIKRQKRFSEESSDFPSSVGFGGYYLHRLWHVIEHASSSRTQQCVEARQA